MGREEQGKFVHWLLQNSQIKFHVRRVWIIIGIVLLSIILGFNASSFLNASRIRVREQLLSIPIKSWDDRQYTLYFPIGSNPQLRTMSIRNVGSMPVKYPRVVINEANPFGSMMEIIQSCRRRYQDPMAVDACMSELLFTNLQHVGNEVVGGCNENFPTSVLEAINYYGYSQCYPTAEYLAQLVRYEGDEACILDFSEHVVTEVRRGDRRYLLDADRNAFYAPDTYDQIISYDKLGKDNVLENTVGNDNPVLLFNNNMATSFSRAGVLANQKVFRGNIPKLSCEPRPLPEFPLERFELLPGDNLIFERQCREPVNGCQAYLERRISGNGEFTIELPYPALEMKIIPLGSSRVKGKLIVPFERPFDAKESQITIDLAGKERAYSRIFRISFEQYSLTPFMIRVKMRYANKWIPLLRDGVNTVRFVAEQKMDQPLDLQIEMNVATRILKD